MKLHFRALTPRCHDLRFACDEHGRVDMDAMDEPMRCNYLFARALVGMEFARPEIEIEICEEANQ